jgi:hypothetical protein
MEQKTGVSRSLPVTNRVSRRESWLDAAKSAVSVGRGGCQNGYTLTDAADRVGCGAMLDVAAQPQLPPDAHGPGDLEPREPFAPGPGDLEPFTCDYTRIIGAGAVIECDP